MSQGRGLAWILLGVWSIWLVALQGLLVSTPWVRAWSPDLGLVLLLALGRRLTPVDARIAALIVAGARVAFTTDPPLAVLAGYLAIAFVASALRRDVEMDRVLPRALFAAAAGLLLSTYWIGARVLRLTSEGIALADFGIPWSSALSTACVAAFFAPALMRLPGLRPLWRKRR